MSRPSMVPTAVGVALAAAGVLLAVAGAEAIVAVGAVLVGAVLVQWNHDRLADWRDDLERRERLRKATCRLLPEVERMERRARQLREEGRSDV